MQSEALAALRKTVLPVLAVSNTGEVHCIGTSFIIKAAGRDALMVTAAHVTAVFNQVEKPYQLHHPSSLFFVQKSLTVLHKTKPRVIWWDDVLGPHTALIGQTVSMEALDLSTIVARFEDHVPTEVSFKYSLAIDTSPVKVGERVIAIGYPDMAFEGDAYTDNAFSGKLYFPTAHVTEVFQTEGPTGQKVSCFRIDAGLPYGMSGGPVITQDASGICYVRGVVRSDIADEKSDTSTGNALVTAIWPIMLLPFSPPDQNNNIDWSKTLLDMQKKGAIIDKGNAAAHIIVERDSEGYILGASYG